MRKIVCAVAFGAVLAGCGNADQEKAKQLQDEVVRLQGEVKSLKDELDTERNGPDRLLARAKNEIASGVRDQAKSTLDQLMHRYPESGQAKSAKVLEEEMDAKAMAEEKARVAEALRKEEDQRLLMAKLDGRLKKNTDEIKGITWISHKSEPVLGKFISLYFGTMDGKADHRPLRMKLQYYAEDWLFVQGVTIKADELTFTMSGLDFERDNGSGRIWEWSDEAVKDRAMIDKIISAKRVIIRFDGRQYYSDFVVPVAHKKAMKDIDIAWERYGGKS